jgi:hypothetical protein
VGVDGDDFIGGWLRLREAWAGNTEKNQRERKGSASAASHCDLVLNSVEGRSEFVERLGSKKDDRRRFTEMVSALPAFVSRWRFILATILFDYEKSKAVWWHGDLQMAVGKPEFFCRCHSTGGS